MNDEANARVNYGPIIYGISCVVLILVVLQLWLLSATVNAALGGDETIVWPAAFASLACLLINLWLLRHFQVLKK